MNLALAVKYGTNESLFLTNLCFWIEKNKANRVNYHDRHYWVYNTMEAWAELFPYFSKDQIRRLINKMRDQKILLVGVYNRIHYDRTQWYSVSDEVMALYLGGFRKEEPGRDGQRNEAGERREFPKTPEEKVRKEPVKSAGEDPSICPPGQMDVAEVPHPSAPQGEWMRRNCHMEAANSPHRSGGIATTIPYIKPINKPDVAAEEIPKGQMPPPVGNPEKAAAAESDKIQKLKEDLSALDYRLVFDTNFYPKAVSYLAKEKLNKSYPAWLYRECRNRKPENLRGLYYALFFQNDMRALFQGQEKKKEAEKPQPVICPVCGIAHDLRLEYCPECNFSRPDVRDEGKIRRHKKYYALSPEDKAAYEREQSELFSLYAKNIGRYDMIKDKWEAIDKKYHLLE
jgi:hypothetical protein